MVPLKGMRKVCYDMANAARVQQNTFQDAHQKQWIRTYIKKFNIEYMIQISNIYFPLYSD